MREGAADQPAVVALSNDGQLVAGGAANGEVRIWKTDGTAVTNFNATPGYAAPKVVEAPKK